MSESVSLKSDEPDIMEGNIRRIGTAMFPNSGHLAVRVSFADRLGGFAAVVKAHFQLEIGPDHTVGEVAVMLADKQLGF